MADDSDQCPAKGKVFARLRRTVTRTVRLAWSASPGGIVAVTVITTVAALLPALVVWLSREVVDLIALAVGQELAVGAILPWTIALGLAGAMQRVLQNMQINRQQVMSRAVSVQAEHLFLTKTAQSELARFDDPSWHDHVQRASRDLNFRPYNVTRQTIGLFGSAITLTGMLGILLGLHPLIVVLVLVSVLVPVPFERRINRDLYRMHFDMTTEERERYYLRSLLSDTKPAKDLRAFVLEAPLLDRQYGLARKHLGVFSRFFGRADRFESSGTLLGGVALVAAYVFVAFQAAAGALSPGDVTALIGAIASVTVQVSSITGSIVGIDEHAPFLDDFYDFLATEPVITVPPEPAVLPTPLHGGIAFEDVVFGYPGQPELALRGLSLRIEDGEMLALVGDNGAGKTTMVKLLQRFYDPQSGTVRVGGVDLRDVHPVELRQRMGLLFQDYTNFSLTARENVSFGRIAREPTDEEIWTALEKARANDIVKDLPKGLDSMLGRLFEGGKDLSGGEWQRLALARLIYRNADIWILDEPTSSLDPEAEAAIFSELKRNLAGRIGIVISHRFSTVRIADRIAVVQDGVITEIGTHDELVALGGRYAHLFEIQAAAYR